MFCQAHSYVDGQMQARQGGTHATHVVEDLAALLEVDGEDRFIKAVHLVAVCVCVRNLVLFVR